MFKAQRKDGKGEVRPRLVVIWEKYYIFDNITVNEWCYDQ